MSDSTAAEPNAIEEPSATSVLAGHDLTGHTVAITGATAGMGAASAHALAAAGARVIVLARNAEALEATVAQVAVAATGAAPAGVRLDLASLRSVREAAGQVAALAPRLDVLMNNAGVMFTPFGRTADGFETQVGVCHLGHFALTEALLPALGAAAESRGSARVVTLASAGHKMSDVDLDDLNWHARNYDKFAAYGAAKTANMLHAVGFGAAHPDRGITAVSVHPGTVATNLARHMTREDFSTMFNYGTDPMARTQATAGGTGSSTPKQRARITSAAEGASTQVWATVAPAVLQNPGAYLADRAVSTDVASYAVDPDRAARLWQLSRDLTR